MSLTREQQIAAQKLARKMKSARKAGLEPEETSISPHLNTKKPQNNGGKKKGPVKLTKEQLRKRDEEKNGKFVRAAVVRSKPSNPTGTVQNAKHAGQTAKPVKK